MVVGKGALKSEESHAQAGSARSLKVNGEFTGRVLDRDGLGICGADPGNALGDRTRDHAGGGHRDGPEDTDGGVTGTRDKISGANATAISWRRYQTKLWDDCLRDVAQPHQKAGGFPQRF